MKLESNLLISPWQMIGSLDSRNTILTSVETSLYVKDSNVTKFLFISLLRLEILFKGLWKGAGLPSAWWIYSRTYIWRRGGGGGEELGEHANGEVTTGRESAYLTRARGIVTFEVFTWEDNQIPVSQPEGVKRVKISRWGSTCRIFPDLVNAQTGILYVFNGPNHNYLMQI